MKRVAAFVRSILPRDLTQLVFLLGCFLLYISPNLRFWPAEWSDQLLHLGPVVAAEMTTPESDTMASWTHVLWLCQCLLFLAASAGLFLWLRPTRNPARNVLLFVCAPACVAVAFICARYLYLCWLPKPPVFHFATGSPHSVPAALDTLSSLGPGLRVAAVGVLCVIMFQSRLSLGLTSLPASLLESSTAAHDDDWHWRRLWIFIWFTLTCSFIAHLVVYLPLVEVFSLMNIHSDPLTGWVNWIFSVSSGIEGAVFAVVAAWAIGPSWWKEFRRFTQSPGIRYLAIGVLIALMQCAFMLVCAYVPDRVEWHGGLVFIEFSSWWLPKQMYYSLHAWLFAGLFVAAFFEEVVFRGYLQPRFIGRYGIARGLFFVGMIWSAFHFFWDFRSTQTEGRVIEALLGRLSICLSMGLVLGWLTLRSRSIWPATFVHAMSNFYLYSIPSRHDLAKGVSYQVFWLVLAYVVSRYLLREFKIQTNDIPRSAVPGSIP